MEKIKVKIIVLTVLFILLILTSVNILQNLRFRYLWKNSSFQAIYHLSDLPHISRIDRNGDNIHIGYFGKEGLEIEEIFEFDPQNINSKKEIITSENDTIILEIQAKNHIHILKSTLPCLIFRDLS
jgi:hypothetical protein